MAGALAGTSTLRSTSASATALALAAAVVRADLRPRLDLEVVAVLVDGWQGTLHAVQARAELQDGLQAVLHSSAITGALVPRLVAANLG